MRRPLHRIYLFQSSSTKLALFFSALLVVALLLLSFEVYAVSHDETVQPIFSKCILALVIFICAGLFGVSFYVTKRINSIVATANRIISTRDLSQRIPIDNPWDDLSKLAEVLNAMLEEIEQLVAGVRQVSDNIAHDLRTPLARLRNHIEEMHEEVSRTGDCHEQQEQLVGLMQECDALLVTFNALLRIANIEVRRRHTGFESLDLAPVLLDVIELYEPVAQEKQITLQHDISSALVIGDKDLLFQAFTNLLDNALKYTPVGGEVRVTLSPRQPSGAELRICDTGPGIADSHKPHVFRRFYRVEACRSVPGSGLGLSLVQAIVQLHQGGIILGDHTPSGLIVTIQL